MELSIKNIGKIANADIKLNGITVVAGENNTGKSTIGKVLYSYFSSCYNLDSQILKTKISGLTRSLELEFNNSSYVFDSDEIARKLFQTKEKFTGNYIDLLDRYMYTSDGSSASPADLCEYAEIIKDKYDSYYNATNEAIMLNVITKKMRAEFNNQINNIFSLDKSSSFCLKIQNEKYEVQIEDNMAKSISNFNSLYTQAVYIDDPNVLDNCTGWRFFPTRRYLTNNHRNDLVNKILQKKSDQDVENALNEIISNDTLESIFELINPICAGNINYSSNILTIKNEDYEPIDVRNLSTGLKSFVILKTLILNGWIENNGMIILDEPETHLHPQWQLVFAELIVLLQKKWNLHILINTHSPYFLNAIQVFSAKHSIADKCNYYLSENNGNVSDVSDVTDNVELIYRKLSRPLQTLENEGYGIYD